MAQLTAYKTGCLQLLEILEISWNFSDAPVKFNCVLKHDDMPITEPNLNLRNCYLTIFCAVLFIVLYITESAFVCIPCCNKARSMKNPAGTLLNVSWKSPGNLLGWICRHRIKSFVSWTASLH